MSIEQFYFAAEIAAAFAFIVSLIYVARQIGQNTDAVQSSVRQAMLAEDRASLQMVMDYPEINKRANLSDKEEIRLQAYLIAFLRMRENHWLQHKSGVLDDATYSSYRNALVPVVFMSEYGTAFWNSPIIVNALDPDYIASINNWRSKLELPQQERMFTPLSISGESSGKAEINDQQ